MRIYPTNRCGQITYWLAIVAVAIGNEAPIDSPGIPHIQDSAAHRPGQQSPLVVYLVRHAEKEKTGDDPELSPPGQQRAATLAKVLQDSGLAYIHSSDYKRTRDSASPIATKLGLTVELYDPLDLPALVRQLRARGGRHLVVGHSNTTPALAELLGGQPGAPIDEAAEYDRLYVVVTDPGGTTTSIILRYGQ